MLIYPPCPPEGSLVDSERVVLRKELASVIAANNMLEKLVLQLRADNAAKDAENSGLRAENGQLREENGQLREENAQLRAVAASLEKALDDAGIKIKDMKRRDAYHDNSNVPPSHRSLTLLEMRREDTEDRRRSSTGRRPGREKGHPGTTSKLDPGVEREDRHADAAECPGCHGNRLRRRRALPKDVVEIEIVKREKRLVFHDLECADCGLVVRASRRGTVQGTILGPGGVALVGSLKQHCRVTAGQLSGFLGDAAGIRVSRAAAAAMIDASSDGLRERADAIRLQERIECNAAEVDETRDRTAVKKMPEDDGKTPPGTGKNRERLEYRDAWDWISVTDRSVVVHVDASRSRAAFEEHMPERIDAATTHDGYGVYGVCVRGQEDWIHKIRAAKHAAKRAKDDPGLQARLEGLAGRIVAEHRRAKAMVPPGGAFQDPDIEEKAKSVEAAMAAIADEYERIGDKKMATYIRSGEGKYATFLLLPAMSSTTAKAEQVAKWLKAWLRNSEKTVTAKGRRRKSDACTAGGTAIRRGGSVYNMLCEDLGVAPPAEYAKIRAEGQRRPRHGTTASGARVRPRRGCGGRGDDEAAAPAAGPPPLHFFGSRMPSAGPPPLGGAGGGEGAAGKGGSRMPSAGPPPLHFHGSRIAPSAGPASRQHPHFHGSRIMPAAGPPPLPHAGGGGGGGREPAAGPKVGRPAPAAPAAPAPLPGKATGGKPRPAPGRLAPPDGPAPQDQAAGGKPRPAPGRAAARGPHKQQRPRRPRPAPARTAAPDAAPDGPGPPTARGPRIPIAAA